MATSTLRFRAETEKIHNEHLTFNHLLHQLDSALGRLECYSEVYANLATAEQVQRCGRRLVEQFPEHCCRAEASLLAPVSAVSPELGEFCGGVKNEHCQLLEQLGVFRAALEELDRAEDLNEAVWHLKEKGKELTGNLRRHVDMVEQELSGFL